MQCSSEEKITYPNGSFQHSVCIHKAEILFINDPCYGLCYTCAYKKLQDELKRLKDALERLATGEAIYVPGTIPVSIQPEWQARRRFIKLVLEGKEVKEAEKIAYEERRKETEQASPEVKESKALIIDPKTGLIDKRLKHIKNTPNFIKTTNSLIRNQEKQEFRSS